MNKINILKKVNQFRNESEYIEVHSYFNDPIDELNKSIKNNSTLVLTTLEKNQEFTNENILQSIFNYINESGFDEFLAQDIENFFDLNFEEQKKELLETFLNYSELFTISNKLYCDIEFMEN